jgi:hypothetical protein
VDVKLLFHWKVNYKYWGYLREVSQQQERANLLMRINDLHTQPSVKWVPRAPYPGGKRPGRDVDY